MVKMIDCRVNAMFTYVYEFRSVSESTRASLVECLRHQGRNLWEWEFWFYFRHKASWVTSHSARMLMSNHFPKAKKTTRVCPGSLQESKLVQRHMNTMKTFLIPIWEIWMKSHMSREVLQSNSKSEVGTEAENVA